MVDMPSTQTKMLMFNLEKYIEKKDIVQIKCL